MSNTNLLLKAGDVVAAYVSHNDLPSGEVSKLLRQVAEEFLSLAEGGRPTPQLEPPVPIEQSYGEDFIICLEDGQRVTLLKRYLARHFNLTPDEYREKWGLPDDYPMVTASYSRQRSKIAKDQGLGKG